MRATVIQLIALLKTSLLSPFPNFHFLVLKTITSVFPLVMGKRIRFYLKRTFVASYPLTFHIHTLAFGKFKRSVRSDCFFVYVFFIEIRFLYTRVWLFLFQKLKNERFVFNETNRIFAQKIARFVRIVSLKIKGENVVRKNICTNCRGKIVYTVYRKRWAYIVPYIKLNYLETNYEFMLIVRGIFYYFFFA